MSVTAIKIENLSKIYRLGEISTGSLGQDVDRWIKTKILGKEDPFKMIGESNDRATKGSSDIIYSLKNINLEINKGDAVGIIGRNGAGKSTLLKILSRVTTPTTGRINIKGRVASLLEVGTGFHPELTGRENIYLNGAILGMRKREIDRKLDEIIDFSGVERYIDTPVKRYSSGMYVRLAFAVAAHLESEILIVDEVLAVGDAEFQQKCLGKMGEVSKGEGRTVLFVSHNIGAIKSLCNKSIFLDKGKVERYGTELQGIKHYIESLSQTNNLIDSDKLVNVIEDTVIKFSSVILSQEGIKIKDIDNDKVLEIEITYEIKEQITGFKLFFYLTDKLDNLITQSFSNEDSLNGSIMNRGIYRTCFFIPSGVLIEGSYFLKIFSGIHDVRICKPENGIVFNLNVIETSSLKRAHFPEEYRGLVSLNIKTETTRL